MAAIKAKKAPKPRKKPQPLAPRTEPADPERGRGLVILPQRSAGVLVNEDTALTQSAVWACIRVISESLAGMPWCVGRRAKDGTLDKLDEHPLEWLLNFQPNDETEAFVFREVLWAWALGWGNGYAEIERDLIGNPVALWQLHPSRVRPMRDARNRLVYEVLNDDGPPDYLYPRDMFHLRGPSPDGLVGWSVIRMHARTIGLAMAQEESAATFNENDSTPGGIILHPGKLTETALQNLRASWERRHAGPKNRRRVAILEEGMKWEQTGLPPEEAQLVEQMQLTPAMICRIFRVPPHKVADLSRSTNNNIEHQDLEFVKDTLRPWAERGEGEADVKLFGRNNQGKLVTFIDMIERERGDTAAQTQHVREMITTGVYSINEGRRYLGLKSIGPEGDKRFIQGAMVPIELAGMQQQPGKPDEPESDDEPEVSAPTMDEGEGELSAMSAAMEVLTDACRRMLAREHDARNLEGESLEKWLSKHREYCRETLVKPARLLSALLKTRNGLAEIVVPLFIEQHLANRSGDEVAKSMLLREMLQAAAAAKEVV
jgi:HK97 family phage portal protein